MRDETRLLRQVHPQFVQQGTPSSQVFRPTPKDEKLLSVYDGDQIDPSDAFEHYTNRLGLDSIGILAVTVGECETCELQPRPDPEAFREHVVIDFSEYGEKDIKKKAKQLKAFANRRGWLYRYDSSPN